MDAEYYYKLMQEYSSKQKEVENKKKAYEDYSHTLDCFKGYISEIESNVSLSDLKLKEGGYISDGESIDCGVLATTSGTLNDICSRVDTVKNGITIKIKEYENEIQKYKSLYEDAYSNYLRCK